MKSPLTFLLMLSLPLAGCGNGDEDYAGAPPAPPDPPATSDALSGTEVAAESPPEVATTVVSSNGDEIGSLIIHPLRQGVRLDLHVEGLKPGVHAVHFHEHGRCDLPDFESAGDHYNPGDGRHGMPDSDEQVQDPDHHAGDMLNQNVDDLGMMDALLVNQSVSIRGGDNALLDEDGSALIIHAQADDYETQPDGAAGERVACAPIVAVE